MLFSLGLDQNIEDIASNRGRLASACWMTAAGAGLSLWNPFSRLSLRLGDPGGRHSGGNAVASFNR
jgi:hypothetical protein